MKDSNLNISVDGQLLNAIFETAIDGIIMINNEGIILKINPAGEQLFGYAPGELIGKKVNDLMPMPDRINHDVYLYDYQNTGAKKMIGKGRDIVGLKKDETTFPCHLSVNEFFMNEERCYAGIIHDLTHRKKAEEEIIELNKQLEEKIKVKSNDLSTVVNKLLQTNKDLEKEISVRKKAEQALRENEIEIRTALKKEKELSDLKSRFVTMASHEFRTPLSTILSSTSLIENYNKKGEFEKSVKHFNKIKSAVKHLTETLDDFLSLTKLEDGKLELHMESFMLLEFCDEFIKENQTLLKKGQTIEKELPKENIELFFDKKLLKHIVFNLFSNATKYSDEGKVIKCKVKVVDNQLIIKIKDQGIGIPSNEQEYLFSRFFRGSNVINISGTGIGLNIVKEYLDLIDGSIHFESIVNEGTIFTIMIPIK